MNDTSAEARSADEAAEPPSTSSMNDKHRHYEDKSLGYHSNSTRDARILRFTGGPGLRVLDIACGRGHIGALIKARGNYVCGSEISESAAAEARKVLDEVHVFDIEGRWPAAMMGEPFDVIVLGEILEHVFDPVAVLSKAREALRPGGRVVITVPNFLVWIARLQVLFGRFRYQPSGLFDFGHIRFFTYKYLKQVLDLAAFSVEEEHHILHPRGLEPMMSRWPSLFALHFVVAARAR